MGGRPGRASEPVLPPGVLWPPVPPVPTGSVGSSDRAPHPIATAATKAGKAKNDDTKNGNLPRNDLGNDIPTSQRLDRQRITGPDFVTRGMTLSCVMLKRLIVLLAFVPFFSSGPSGTVPSAIGSGGKVGPDCSLKGKKLFGKVKIVDAFPDLKVQVVDAFPDKCGKWKMVDAFPDVKIQMVTAFPDLKIKYVNAFPGLP